LKQQNVVSISLHEAYDISIGEVTAYKVDGRG